MNGQRHTKVQSIDRAVQILRCFDAANPELGISDLARRTGLSTSTVHRLLGSMLENDLIRQSLDRRYALGPLVVQLATGGALAGTLRSAARPHAQWLRDETNETVGVHEHIPGGRRVVIDQVESRQELRRTYTEFGSPIRIVHGAPGKAILAFLPGPEQERYLAEPIESATPRTITDPDALRADLARTRGRGFAYSDAERTPGIRSLAAPIFDVSGSVLGSIGVSVPALRVPDERVEELGLLCRDAARSVSEALGATGETIAQALARAEAPDATGGPNGR
ncbi:IclR family transcriptional regulator [Ornithinimicrobium cavernae]|uniref:IclR family transcriptional regulator n=1 Tax=Ornithinimicrobium cavernae TaxID=2666047 RepID=UPI000D69C41B|nr:IclR family transcriptional regulator [Ornithinimicrobium cavernae]